jgi:hypothetical protein
MNVAVCRSCGRRFHGVHWPTHTSLRMMQSAHQLGTLGAFHAAAFGLAVRLSRNNRSGQFAEVSLRSASLRPCAPGSFFIGVVQCSIGRPVIAST